MNHRLLFLVLPICLWACGGGGLPLEPEPLKVQRRVESGQGLYVEITDMQALRDHLNRPSARLRVVHLWATWCPPCLRELANWQQLRQEYAQVDADWLFVDLSREQDWERETFEWLQKYPNVRPCYHINPDSTEGKFALLHPDWQGSLPATLLLRADQSMLLEKAMSIEELRQHFKSFGL